MIDIHINVGIHFLCIAGYTVTKKVYNFDTLLTGHCHFYKTYTTNLAP